MASIILGKWENTSNENFEAYLKALGFDPPNRNNWPHNVKSFTEFIQGGDGKITQKNTVGPKTIMEFTFGWGVETEHNFPVPGGTDGKIMSSKFLTTLEGNKMIQKGITNGIEAETIREFNGDEMVAIHKAGSVIAVRKYVKVA